VYYRAMSDSCCSINCDFVDGLSLDLHVSSSIILLIEIMHNIQQS